MPACLLACCCINGAPDTKIALLVPQNFARKSPASISSRRCPNRTGHSRRYEDSEIVVLATAGVVIVGVLLIQRSEPLIVLRRPTTTLNVPAQVPWYDTGVTVSAGDHITFKASGKIYIGAVNAGQPSISDYQGPAGAVGTNTSDQGKRLAFIAPGLVPWSLVGKIGPSGAPFQVGEQTTVTAQVAGRVFLTVNDNNFGDNSGSWNVSVAIQDP